MNLLHHAFSFLADNPHLWLSKAGYQLELSLLAIGGALVLSLPLGVITGHLHRWSFLAISVGNVARALPTLAIIAVLISLVGIGFTNIWIALVVLAIPPVLTNTYVAVDGVDRGVVEAARGIGMRWWQILFKVELPIALPLILAGIQTGAVFVIATAYMSSFAGSNATLGAVIVDQAQFGLGGVLGAAAVVVVMAFLVEGLIALTRRLLTPRGLRLLHAGQGVVETEVVSLTPAGDHEPRKDKSRVEA